MRRVGAALLLIASAWLLAASSGYTVAWYGEDAALLRLSWVARPERIEECRVLSEAELAARPAHMRQARECSGGSATYRLAVTVDGVLLGEEVLEGGGLRKDRAIFVLREYPLRPGARHVQLRFARVEPVAAPMDSANVRRGAVARELVLDTIIRVPSAAVALASLGDGNLSLLLP